MLTKILKLWGLLGCYGLFVPGCRRMGSIFGLLVQNANNPNPPCHSCISKRDAIPWNLDDCVG